MSAIHINNQNYKNEVLHSDKPVLLDFWAPWCGPCRMVLPTVEEIAKERQDIKVGKINVDEEESAAVKYRISSIPNIIAFQNGGVKANNLGFVPAEALEAFVKANL